jgi:hypothetical protein
LGKDSGSQSATQIQDIPEWAQPYSRALLSSGAAAAGRPYQQYEGVQNAPMNESQLTAMGLTSGTALNGDPTTNASLGQFANTAAGNYSNPWATTYNPYAMTGNPQLEQMIQAGNAGITKNYNQAVKPGTDSMFARAGAFGGSAYMDKTGQDQAQLAGALANNETNLRFQDYGQKANLMESALGRGNNDYEAERGRMLQAAQGGMAGDQIQFGRAKALAGTGDAMQQYSQSLLDTEKSEFEKQQNYPWMQIDQLGAVLGKALGGSSQTTTTMQMPKQYGGVAGAIGGGAAGYGLSQMMGNSPFAGYMPAIGAGLGYFG